MYNVLKQPLFSLQKELDFLKRIFQAFEFVLFTDKYKKKMIRLRTAKLRMQISKLA